MAVITIVPQGEINFGTFRDDAGDVFVLCHFIDAADREIEISFNLPTFVAFADHAGSLSDAIVSGYRPPA